MIAARRPRVAITVAGVVLSAVAAWLTASGSDSDRAWLEALARASIVAVPIGVGVYAWERPPFRRSGEVLVGAGVAWFLTTLSEASDPVLYSTGRIAGWLVELVLLYLVLAYPTGRLSSRVDRALVTAMALVIAVLYLPTALLVEQYPTPTPWTGCVNDCPPNAFQVVDHEPAFVDDLVRPLREVLSTGIFVVAALWLGRRMQLAGPLSRRTLAPVVVVACARSALFAAAIVARGAAPESGAVQTLTWLIALMVPAMALAVLGGLLSWRLFVASALQRLVAGLPPDTEPEGLRASLADAFEDPDLQIAYWLRTGEEHAAGHWADAGGQPVRSPPPGSGRSLTVAYDDGRKVAAIVHDAALAEEQAFVDAATAYAVIALDNERLSAETSWLLREVADSRMRIQASADDERRRIERDLHVGAQHRLAALRIKLELAAEQMEDGTRSGDPAVLRTLIAEVDTALDVIGSLARGIYPAALDRGLVEAIRAAALQGPLPTSVLATGVGRYSRDFEGAVYFACLEALQNAAKHATGATVAVVELSCKGGVLRLDVHDDGAGYDVERATEGVGLTNMRDRLSAVGGELEIRSSPGRGTHVIATVPIGAVDR